MIVVLLLLLVLAAIFVYALSFIIKKNYSERGNKKLAWFVVLILIPFTFALYLLGKRNKIKF